MPGGLNISQLTTYANQHGLDVTESEVSSFVQENGVDISSVFSAAGGSAGTGLSGANMFASIFGAASSGIGGTFANAGQDNGVMSTIGGIFNSLSPLLTMLAQFIANKAGGGGEGAGTDIA